MASNQEAVSPYLKGNYAPIEDELESVELAVLGELPPDLSGAFARNSPNPRFPPNGLHHWFDGDGMVHAVSFEGGKARYTNRWVRTQGLGEEEEAGRALWAGMLEPGSPRAERPGLKNTANTDLVFHAGRLLALWWVGGEPYVLELPSLRTVGIETFGGRMPHISAHPKVDPVTGEMMVFNYGPRPPFLTYGVVSPTGELTHRTALELAGPRLQHDIAITARHTLFFDMSLMWDPALLAKGQTRLSFFRDRPSRIGVLPRHGEGVSVRWFECSPFFMYHTVNAWEEGDEIVLIGLKIDAPLMGDLLNPKASRMIPSIGYLRLEPRLHRWRLDLASGAVKEEWLDERLTEFPRMDNRRLGRPNRYAYHPLLAAQETVLFEGFVQYDLQTGCAREHRYPADWFGGEVVFAPRAGRDGEDEGYLLTFVTHEETLTSELQVFDAQDVEAGPVARLRCPRRVPTGFHAWWVPAAELGRG